jgi:fructosamine-3-kinase
MSAFAARVAALAGVDENRLERLAGGDLSEVLLVSRNGGDAVAKGGPVAAVEAAMLRTLRSVGVPAPMVEGEFGDVLMMEHVPNDRVFSARAWSAIGEVVRHLHEQKGERYGWPSDYRLGSVELPNKEQANWAIFWGEQRLLSTAAILDRPIRERVERLAGRLPDLLPAHPPASLLHGDLWSGNILVQDGDLAALIDPACYYGDSEADLAMLTLFDAPPEAFWEHYGTLASGWEERRPVYQLFPALVHLRLFGASYASMVDRLLESLGA